MRTFEKLKLTPEQVADLIDSDEEIDAARGEATGLVASYIPNISLPLKVVISRGLGTLETHVLAALIDTDWTAVTKILDERHPEVARRDDSGPRSAAVLN